ncbi:hypothetical protein FOL46_000540 [Perkinsus olseni]|uniref:Uncharacterized protein n=1 Tax=Perkinsus olseni TaxID=32597 RepID=A0A7J6MHL1_PEROL|nr:hypothetical protein FOL46_000540 [Perkinsus olseni]
MTSIVIVLAAIAATVVAEGTTALNTTYPPTPDLNRGPPITGHDVWWMLASKKIDELLQAEQEAAGPSYLHYNHDLAYHHHQRVRNWTAPWRGGKFYFGCLERGRRSSLARHDGTAPHDVH